MSKISLIIRREYMTRVRKKSFIIMTVIGPLLMAAAFIIPVYLATIEGEMKMIGVIDESGLFTGKFKDTESFQFISLHDNLETAKNRFSEQNLYAILFIPGSQLNLPHTVLLYSDKQPNINVKLYIKSLINKELEEKKLSASGIDLNILKAVKTDINLRTIKMNRGGEEEQSSTELSMALGFITGLMIYIFIFMYGSQVMRGVIEEKTSRIIEVIVSSVRPFQLMMGKIIGVALVGLTQFVLWIILTFALVTVFTAGFKDEIGSFQKQEMLMNDQDIVPRGGVAEMQDLSSDNEAVIAVFEAINSINFGVVAGAFLFFFLGGYLLYAAFFASIGSAVDNETDTQQFMLPITMPLIIAIVSAQFIINDPDGPVAFWFSIIPLTSPVVMMIRIPFGVPVSEILLSAFLLVAAFFGSTWMAAKIYRTGILMYGKKVSYRELWKWLRYRN